MTYRESEKHLNDRQMFGIKLGLSNTKRLLRRLGSPEREFKSIHIAGTNGKGSTAAMLASILIANGFRTGMFTSPHISTVRERFRVDGSIISKKDFTRLYARIIPHFRDISLTYFECVTALAFLWFREQKTDIAVVEVGMGGRFDATNVLKPLCSVITSIGFDHQQYLGDTLSRITFEKCGIIKKGIPVVSGVEQPLCRKIVHRTAQKRRAPYYETKNLVSTENIKTTLNGSFFDAHIRGNNSIRVSLPLAGSFQVGNALTALAVAAILSERDIEISDNNVREGLASVNWPERFSLYRTKPELIIDVAHNESAFFMLKKEIRKLFPGKNVLLVINMKDEKDWKNALRPIIPACRAVVGIPVSGVRGVLPEHFSQFFKQENIPFRHFSSIKGGIQFALKQAGKNDLIVCAGSHYTVKEIKKVVNSLD